VTADISADTKPIQHKPFVVFHDAYQYFEKRFGLTAVGSISDVSAAAEAALKVDPMFSANAWVDAQPFEDRQMNQRFLAALEAAGMPN
jgi:zinc transport system substrate-binding protein